MPRASLPALEINMLCYKHTDARSLHVKKRWTINIMTPWTPSLFADRGYFLGWRSGATPIYINLLTERFRCVQLALVVPALAFVVCIRKDMEQTVCACCLSGSSRFLRCIRDKMYVVTIMSLSKLYDTPTFAKYFLIEASGQEHIVKDDVITSNGKAPIATIHRYVIGPHMKA
jgi:hypothetical protein